MSHLAYAWELGGGAGHIGGFAAIARSLQSSGHEVTFIVKDLVNTEALVGDRGFPVFQAPTRHITATQPQITASYSGMLLSNGFDQELALRARVKAWVNLLKTLAPELLIIDHSPTALVAARILSIPYVLFGTGFFAPPILSPMPSFRTWLHIPPGRLEQTDIQVIHNVNKVLTQFAAEPLNSLSDLFAAQESFLCTFKELDHYPMRTNASYWGPRFESENGDEATWPLKGRRKIFVYVHPYYPNLHNLLEALQKTEYSVLVYCPGIPVEFIGKYQHQRLIFTHNPVRLDHIAKQCDLVVCNSGHGMVSAMLLSGIPLLLLPIHVEQLIIARHVAGLGAGLFVLPENRQPQLDKTIDSLLNNKSFKKTAQAFAEKYADYDIYECDKAIVDRIEEILK